MSPCTENRNEGTFAQNRPFTEPSFYFLSIIGHHSLSRANGSLISSSSTGFSVARRLGLSIHTLTWEITGECFTHSLHSREYIHSIHAKTHSTEMFTRQAHQNLKSVTVKIKTLHFLVGHSDRKHGKQVTTFSRHTKTLVGKFGKITDPKSEDFEVGNGKNYRHPQIGSKQKRSGAKGPPEFVPESPLHKGVFGSHLFSKE